ncbi:peptide-methionine (S)-S-oxide reductase MsrA [Pedobacter sp. SYSU D00535]|uniref:peptide-methionine (S)-S-oxide reductase MsrA n=1 Tax=Pedobacter sp. SYSU D00535 TaxID=2810308 RepID=UPI001F61A2C3|nr:peptide-methionine (S)-S-oxide reductase MsrA [Pedobacter sp. SYSU D00535]
MDDPNELAVFGGGCFWCVEALIQQLDGVLTVESGYSGGKGFNPTYREVASGLTGHAEMVRVKFNPRSISYEQLLKLFFSIHDGSSIDPEGGNYTQYRSIILYYNEGQKEVAEAVKAKMEAAQGKVLHTEIAPFKAFYKAEEKHQNYFQKNPEAPYCTQVIVPKLEKLKARLKGV